MNKTASLPGTIEDRVFDLISEEADLPRQSLDRDTSLTEIGDSLTRVETVMKLEDEFEVSLSDEQVDTVRTIGDLVEMVETAVRLRDGGGAKPATDENAPPSP